jgi:hypothetical protein
LTTWIAAAAAIVFLSASAALAQDPAAQQPAQAPAQPERADPDVRIDPLQPDFTIITLPTTLRMPSHKWGFRVTHRFTRSLGEGSFSDLVSDLFGFDEAAQVGLELRFGLLSGTQIGVHRTSDRTIQIFGQHNFLSERREAPLGLDALVAYEGENNMREEHKGIFGLVVSRNLFQHVAAYAVPLFITNPNRSDLSGSDDYTVMIGLGARARVLRSMYLLAEFAPRFGFDPGAQHLSFAVEGRAGGHSFQLNFSNGFGTTLAQIGKSGIDYDQWYLGFNISRKFF